MKKKLLKSLGYVEMPFTSVDIRVLAQDILQQRDSAKGWETPFSIPECNKRHNPEMTPSPSYVQKSRVLLKEK